MSKKERGKNLDLRIAEIEDLLSGTFASAELTREAITMHSSNWRRRDKWICRWLFVLVLIGAAALGLGFAAFISLGQSGVLNG